MQTTQNTGSSSYHCCNRVACLTSWSFIDADKPALLASPSSDAPVPLTYPSPSAPLCLLKYSGRLKLTGSLGEVIRMNGELALSWGWCCIDWEPVVNDVFWRGCLLSRNLRGCGFSACACSFVIYNDESQNSIFVEWLFCFHPVYNAIIRSLPSSLQTPTQRVMS